MENARPTHDISDMPGVVQRIALVALACILAFTTFISAITIAELHDHDCVGDDCTICLVLEHAQAMLASAAAPTNAGAAAQAFVLVAVAMLAAWTLHRVVQTPVRQGVKLII